MTGTLYLTFDDGPSEAYTPALLTLLGRWTIPATFFTVGEFAAAFPELIRRELAEGHAVQVHANRHRSAYLRSRRDLAEDMASVTATLRGLGAAPTLYRPPWGHTRRFSADLARQNGLRMVRWDVMAEDWSGTISPEEIAQRLLERVFPGAVICLHDGRGRNGAPGRTVEALRQALPILLERGYRFERME